MQDLATLKQELLKDPEVKAQYEKDAPKYQLISELIAARHKAGLTQKELANKVGTRQASISRLEGGNINPSLGFLEKVATAIGAKLTVQLSS